MSMLGRQALGKGVGGALGCPLGDTSVSHPSRLPFWPPAVSPAPLGERQGDGTNSRASSSLRVSELSRTVSVVSASYSVNEPAHSRRGSDQGESSRNSVASGGGPPTTSGELSQLIDESLGPASPVWRAKREADRGVLLQKQQRRGPWQPMQSGEPPNAADLAYHVGAHAKVNEFDEALELMEELLKQNKTAALERIKHKTFMESAQKYRNSAAAVAFLHTLPKRFHDIRLYNMALQACAASRDYSRALEVMDLVDKLRVKKDVKLLTSMINVCKSVGNAERAFKYLSDMKAESMALDAVVYGAVVSACAEAMLRELSVVHERKDQFVLLERAFQLLEEAVASGQLLSVVVYNALLVCAGRSGQLGRAFQVLDRMAAHKVLPDAKTYGALLEACVQAGRQELALKVFSHAIKEGFTSHIELYTQAVSACKIEGSVDLGKALSVYAVMQRYGVPADKKFYAALMAVSGKAMRLDLALSDLQSVADDHLVLGSTLANALLYAAQHDLGLMRKIYTFCANHGVYPEVSQYNRLMDWYTERSRFGEVVSLVCDMVQEAHLVPNLNTFRIIFNACQKADQAQLALEVYSTMKSRKIPILQDKFARVIFYSLMKTCQNQILYQWAPQFDGKPTPWKGMQTPVVRMNEAEKLLKALRSVAGPTSASISGRATSAPGTSHGPHHGHSHAGPLSLLSLPPESINWQQQALMLYRDYITTGYKPCLQVVDLMMRCLRMRLPVGDGSSTASAAAGASSAVAVAAAAGEASAASAAAASSGPLSHAPSTSSPLQHLHSALPVHMAGTLPVHLVGGPAGHLPSHLGGSHLGLGLTGMFAGSSPRSSPLSSSPVPKQPWEPPSVLPPTSTASTSTSSSSSSTPTSSSDAAAPRRTAPHEQRYEMLFDRRALSLLDDAMVKGYIPSIKGVEDGPCTFDLRTMPPTLAELIVLAVLAAFEKRAAKTGRYQVFHNVAFLVPAFDADLALWPSYVVKMSRHRGGADAVEEDAVVQGAQAVAAEEAAAGTARGGDAGSAEEAAASGQQQAEAGPAEKDAAAPPPRLPFLSSSFSAEEEEDEVDEDELLFAEEAVSVALYGHQQHHDLLGVSSTGASISSFSSLGLASFRGMPFTAADAADASRPLASTSSPELVTDLPEYQAGCKTSLAVAGACRRMKVYSHLNPKRGVVTLSSRELSRWLHNRRSYEQKQQQQQQQRDGGGAEGSESAASGGSSEGQRRRSSHRYLFGSGAGRVQQQQQGQQQQTESVTGSRSSDDEEQTSSGGLLMKRPKHRHQFRKVKQPGSGSRGGRARGGGGGAAGGNGVVLAGTGTSPGAAGPGQAAVDHNTMATHGMVTVVGLGAGIHISSSNLAAKGERAGSGSSSGNGGDQEQIATAAVNGTQRAQ